MLQGYFQTIPQELEEAGLVDGLSRTGVILKITLPLSLPAIASVSLFIFMVAWNEYLFAYMFLDTPADTSAHTYGVLMKVFNASYTGRVGGTGVDGNYNQHMRCPCTITVMEVGV